MGRALPPGAGGQGRDGLLERFPGPSLGGAELPRREGGTGRLLRVGSAGDEVEERRDSRAVPSQQVSRGGRRIVGGEDGGSAPLKLYTAYGFSLAR